jgi:nucleoside phosphorylase
MKYPKTDLDFARHIIEFDPRNRSTYAEWTEIEPILQERAKEVPWPSHLAPKPKPYSESPDSSDPLPEAEYLVVTWTTAENHALADMLTPGYSKTSWYNYDRFFDSHYKHNIQEGAPSLEKNRLGSFFPISIGEKSVLCFKSELHMDTDGLKLPIRDLWKQTIQEVKPKLVVTTGTAGAIGSDIKVGDVIIGRKSRFDCDKMFVDAPFNKQQYTNKTPVPITYLQDVVDSLIPVNAKRLPNDSQNPKIYYDLSPSSQPPIIVTTDFFAFDDTTDTYKLQGLGSAVEMDDATLGLSCQDLQSEAPDWFVVRNASDPQIDGSLPLQDQKRLASQTYEKYGYWTTIDSAITTWAVIAGYKTLKRGAKASPRYALAGAMPYTPPPSIPPT